MSVKLTAEFTCNGCGAKAKKVSKRQWGIGLPKGWGTPEHIGRRARGPARHYCVGCNRAAKAAVRAALSKRGKRR